MQGVPLPCQAFLYNDYARNKKTLWFALFLRQEFPLHILLHWIYFMSCSKSFIFLRFSLLCVSRKFKIIFPWLFVELFKFHIFPMPLLYPGRKQAPSNITFKSMLFLWSFLTVLVNQSHSLFFLIETFIKLYSNKCFYWKRFNWHKLNLILPVQVKEEVVWQGEKSNRILLYFLMFWILAHTYLQKKKKLLSIIALVRIIKLWTWNTQISSCPKLSWGNSR